MLVVLPFFRVNGESAFRFDVPTLRLLFFGTVIWMEDFFIVLIAILTLTFLTLFITTAFGRIWCGWLCPQTVLVDLSPFLERTEKKGIGRLSAAYVLAAAAGAVIAASLIGYFVSPYDAIPLFRSGGASVAIIIGSWMVLSVLLFLDLVALRRTFCSTVCPYAKMQGVLFDDRTLIVAFDQSRREECLRCSACMRVCPVGIDIRKGMQTACIHCAECIDACTERMAACARSSLIDYVFGESGGSKRGPRISLYLTGGLAIASVFLFLYLMAVRVPFEVTVSPIYNSTVAVAADASIANQYTFSLRKTNTADLEVSLLVSAPSGSASVLPDVVRLARGQESIKVPITITIRGLPDDGRRYLPLTLVAKQGSLNRKLKKPISFLLPER